MSNQPYNKSCNNCGEQIRMQQVNGKWASYNITGTEFHKCKNKNGGHGQVAQTQEAAQKPEVKTQTSLTLEGVDGPGH